MTTSIIIDPQTDILGVIDAQPDFMAEEGGPLGVPGGRAVLAPINRLLFRVFRRAWASQDWHPANHLSFASQHPGRAAGEMVDLASGPQMLWPTHCVQGSPGAALHAALDDSRVEIIIRKGMQREVDSYSAFMGQDRSPTSATGLAAWLRAQGIRRNFLTGVTRPYCVDFTAADSIAEGFETFVVEDACSRLGAVSNLDASRARLEALGVRFVTSSMLRPEHGTAVA